MAKYFNYFPQTAYYLSDDNSSLDVVTNIMSRFSFNATSKDKLVMYSKYDIFDGETPEIIADKLYGSPEKHWIILSVNNIKNPQFDWPLRYNDLTKYIDIKYRGVTYANTANSGTGLSWAKSHTHSYYINEKRTLPTGDETLETIIIDAATFANTNTTSTVVYTLYDSTNVTITTTKSSISYYEYEIEENEGKRTIDILRPEFVKTIEQEFRNVIA
jgi:hypothetical protein